MRAKAHVVTRRLRSAWTEAMFLWRVHYLGKALGTVDAPDEKSAIAEATKQFHITAARWFLIRVTRADAKD
jgi:hypothetical protein